MRKVKYLVVLVLLALLVSAGHGGVMSQGPPTAQVPARVPSDQQTRCQKKSTSLVSAKACWSPLPKAR